MATYTSNYGWTKPGGNDQVDISVLNGNLDSQDAIMHKAFTNMAQAFSAASTYAVGDIVLYDNVLYKCHTAVTVAGAWTGSTNWQVYKLAEGGGGGTSNYNDLTNKPSINNVTLSGNKTTSDLGINADNVMMSDGVTSVEEAVDEVTGKIEKIMVQAATGRVTGISGNWVYMNVTFNSPFKKQPLVTVNQYDTGTGNSWYPPILKNITVNGFTAGWYNVTGTKEFIWQAIGVV